jgi:hypothetical protein
MNNVSSGEAFSRFRMWMKSRTVLKLTMLEKDARPRLFVVEVASVDEESSQIGFSVYQTRSYLPPVDLNGASFQIGSRVLKAERSAEAILSCEEAFL